MYGEMGCCPLELSIVKCTTVGFCSSAAGASEQARSVRTDAARERCFMSSFVNARRGKNKKISPRPDPETQFAKRRGVVARNRGSIWGRGFFAPAKEVDETL